METMFQDRNARRSAADPDARDHNGYRKPIQHSVIGADLTITGELVSTGDIKVDGRVDGNITCRTLTLGDQPLLNSEIAAETVRICGTFNGQVRANKVVLTKDAKVRADIAQEILEIEAGATLEGEIKRLAPIRLNGAS
jgi:cytoskeletal protein CcmA (bactofilin family)